VDGSSPLASVEPTTTAFDFTTGFALTFFAAGASVVIVGMEGLGYPSINFLPKSVANEMASSSPRKSFNSPAISLIFLEFPNIVITYSTNKASASPVLASNCAFTMDVASTLHASHSSPGNEYSLVRASISCDFFLLSSNGIRTPDQMINNHTKRCRLLIYDALFCASETRRETVDY
jgi:hypothetical protein